MDIDFVVTWVDMEDPKWQAEFAKYSGIRKTQRMEYLKLDSETMAFLNIGFVGLRNLPLGFVKYILSLVDRNLIG